MHFGRSNFTLFFNKNANRYALLNIENIFILAAIGSNLFLLGIAVQVKDINIGKSIH